MLSGKGSEAAIIQRVRNSSLVEWRCAENLPGLSIVPKLWMCFKEHVVGERSKGGEVESRGSMERLEVRMPV